MRRILVRGGLLLLGALAIADAARAQSTDPYTAEYCEPDPQTKLIYTDRAYLILPKATDTPPLYFSYQILGTRQLVRRNGQFLFDAGDDQWQLQSDPDAIRRFWPLKPEKMLELERVNRSTGAHAHVSLVVLGLEPIQVNHVSYQSWEIRRLDTVTDGESSMQFLWYAPELCALSAFTDSQHRFVRLLRILKPGDPDYDRSLVRRNHHLYFADTGEMVK